MRRPGYVCPEGIAHRTWKCFGGGPAPRHCRASPHVPVDEEGSSENNYIICSVSMINDGNVLQRGNEGYQS